MNRVMLPLNQMGARLNGSNESEFPPITIQGTRDLSPIDYSMPVASAQVKSALLFAALQAQGYLPNRRERTEPQPYGRNDSSIWRRDHG